MKERAYSVKMYSCPSDVHSPGGTETHEHGRQPQNNNNDQNNIRDYFISLVGNFH